MLPQHQGKIWLGRGASVAIFPEGTRSKDGEIHRFKAGAFTLAKEAGVEILPVVMTGTATMFRGWRMNWTNRIRIRVLPPVSVEEAASMEIKELAQTVQERMTTALENMESKMINMNNDNKPTAAYDDDAIRTLSPREHLRLRPGMYIGKLGDGSQPDDGIYVLIKETVDNSIDEFIMGAGNRIDITIEDNVVTVRDYGRGIPLKSLSAAVSKMNTGGKGTLGA